MVGNHGDESSWFDNTDTRLRRVSVPVNLLPNEVDQDEGKHHRRFAAVMLVSYSPHGFQKISGVPKSLIGPQGSI